MFIRVLFVCVLAARGYRETIQLHMFDNQRDSGISWVDGKTVGMNCSFTGYDRMLLDKDDLKKKIPKKAVGRHTALLVIDTQRGFTVNNRDGDKNGGFAQQCLVSQNEHHQRALAEIVHTVNAVKAAGGLMVATKDIHPKDHCSFLGQSPCLNNRAAADTYTEETLSLRPQVSTTYTTNRYTNEFPPHCVGTLDGKVKGRQAADWVAQPDTYEFHPHPAAGEEPVQSETELHPEVRDAMQDYERSFIAYKGFSRDYDSFSAFPMRGEPSENSHLVGAKLWLGQDGTPQKFDDDVNPAADKFKHYETKTSLTEFKPLQDFLREQNITQVLVVGYVYDFCVKETAIGAVQQGFEDTTVLTVASRPAADGFYSDDGKAGLPGVPDSGRGSDEEVLLGSEEASSFAFWQLYANKVKQESHDGKIWLRGKNAK